MAHRRVTCILKNPPHSKHHEHITYIGNSAEGWVMPREEVIRRIESKTDSFYVLDEKKDKQAWVGVIRVPGHEPHLRTHADNDWNDNLLSLNTC